MKTVSAIAILATIALFAPRPVAAQSCGYVQICGADKHLLDATPDNSCYVHLCEGPCSSGVCHPMCGTCPPDFGANPILQQKLVALQMAASEGDVDKVLRLAEGMPSYVAFNVARQSVQLRSCSGESIMANLPIRNESQRQLALRLPTPAQMFVNAKIADLTSGYVIARTRSALGLAMDYLAPARSEDGFTLAQILAQKDETSTSLGRGPK